jgi:hypothetical protein
LTASEQEGQPISGKFEVEEGQFQLSIYTAKGGKFSEVLVDYTTGKVAKVEPITKPDDVAEATSQSAAMAKAKIPLREAVEKAASEAPDFRPVSVRPDLRDGHVRATGGNQRAVTPGAHAIVLLDQAGWHGAKALKVPSNLSSARARSEGKIVSPDRSVGLRFDPFSAIFSRSKKLSLVPRPSRRPRLSGTRSGAPTGRAKHVFQSLSLAAAPARRYLSA